MNQKVTNKLNRNVQKALLLAQAKAEQVKGFDKFSYTLEWHHFPGSLKVTCHFSSEEHLQRFYQEQKEAVLIKALQHSFLKVGIVFKQIQHNVLFSA